MDANFVLGGITVYGSTRYRVPVGTPFKIFLVDAPHKMRWFADNDEVLSVDQSPDGFSADIVAGAVGNSDIQLQGRGPHLDLLIHVEVYQPGTTSVEATFTNIRPKP